MRLQATKKVFAAWEAAHLAEIKRDCRARSMGRSRELAHVFTRWPATCSGCKKTFCSQRALDLHHNTLSATAAGKYPLDHFGQRQGEAPFWDVPQPICVCMLHFFLQQAQWPRERLREISSLG